MKLSKALLLEKDFQNLLDRALGCAEPVLLITTTRLAAAQAAVSLSRVKDTIPVFTLEELIGELGAAEPRAAIVIHGWPALLTGWHAPNAWRGTVYCSGYLDAAEQLQLQGRFDRPEKDL